MSESWRGRVRQLAEQCAAVQLGIEQRQGDAHLLRAFQQAQQQCEAAASCATGAGEKEALTRLATVVGTWHQVWPRLGAQPDFRMAVAREARLWAQRLTELAPQG